VVAGPSLSTRTRRSWSRGVSLAVTAAFTLVALSGCSFSDVFAFGWPEGITPQAERMYDMWVGSVIAALVVGVFVWGLIFWCVVRYRKRGSELPPQTRYNLPLEILYTVAPFLVIAVLFYYTAIIQSYVDETSEDPDVTVEVVGFQWNWEFIYTGTEGPDGEPISTLGTDDYIPVLVLPANRTVQFIETSPDVIHSFWVPELLFKRDVIPGYENRFEVTLQEEGAYVGRCAELCGTYHAQMNFELRVVSWEEYQQFLELRAEGASTPEALEAIGEEPYAVTTRPFDTERDSREAS